MQCVSYTDSTVCHAHPNLHTLKKHNKESNTLNALLNSFFLKKNYRCKLSFYSKIKMKDKIFQISSQVCTQACASDFKVTKLTWPCVKRSYFTRDFSTNSKVKVSKKHFRTKALLKAVLYLPLEAKNVQISCVYNVRAVEFIIIILLFTWRYGQKIT